MTTKQVKLTSTSPSRRSDRFTAVGLLIAVAIGSVCTTARAESATPPSAASTAPAALKSGASTDALLQFSLAGRDAFDNIRMARLDLFNGRTDAALKEMKAAQVSLITAKVEAPTFVTSTQTKMLGKVVSTTKETVTADIVPVSGDLVLADNFQLTEQQKPLIEKAKAHLAKGDKKAAVEVLKQGDVDVTYNRQWLSISSTQKNLDKAIDLASGQKFYDANLVLKAIEDGVQMEVVSFDVHPAAS